ncbi:hypothetical protein JCM8097_000628 [Rhodosporidiobolus ruineniae]
MDPDAQPGGVSPSAPSPFSLDNSFSALADLLSHSTGVAGLDTLGTGSLDAYGSPAAGQHGAPVDFNDLLAQFTLPGGALSPAPGAPGSTGGGAGGIEQARSPDASGLMQMLVNLGSGSVGTPGGSAEGGGGGGAMDAFGGRNPQEVLFEQLRAFAPAMSPAAGAGPAATAGPASSPDGRGGGAGGGSDRGGGAGPAPGGSPQRSHQPLNLAAPISHPPGVDVQAQLQHLIAQTLGAAALQSGTPTPTGPPPSTNGNNAPFYPPAHLQQSSATNFNSPQSPTGYSQASSAQASPMPSYPHGSVPPSYPGSVVNSPYQQASNPPLPSSYPSHLGQQTPQPQHQPQLLPPQQQQPQLNGIPPVLQQLLANPAMQQGGQQSPLAMQAQLAAMQLLLNANAQLQAQAHAVQAQAQAQAQAHAHAQAQQQAAEAQAQADAQAQAQQQAQAHAQAVAAAQVQLQNQQQGQLGNGTISRAGSIHLPSQGTSLDGSYRENEYLFSPLMSPAMTPHSVFTNASSLPPSVGPVPLVSPADFFPPLTSPALGPQLYPGEVASAAGNAASRLAHHRNSLQGLVDGVGALSTQLPPGAASPSSFFGSPRLNPTDAGTSTAAGTGRRGAGAGASKKTRPSPLIKPSDPALERKRRKGVNGTAGSVQGDKRAGSKSATSSPFLGPSGPGSNHVRAASATSGSSRPSPSDAQHSAASASVGSIDTPSPVDLSVAAPGQPGDPTAGMGLPVPPPSLQAQVYQTMMQPPLHQQQHQQQAQPPFLSAAQPYQLEPMGPPPVPSSSSSSAVQPYGNHHLPPPPHPSSAAPVTPASFMNFSSDFDMNALSSLGPIPQSAYESSVPGSAFSSVQNSPALLPQQDGGMNPAYSAQLPLLPLPPSSLGPGADQQMNEGGEETFIAPPPPQPTAPSSGKAPKPRKTPASAKASPALKAVDAKGKGKAAAGGAAGGRKKPQKIAPSPRIEPSPKIRPLLASGATPDAQARLASKSNYENILDGHGDLLGLPASMQSQLQAQTSAAAASVPPDNRRSSHKVAEQKRRDSLKLCFDELRKLLPPILPYTDESDRRPGDGNVGGQRHGEVDPEAPNKGVSKVALLRRSNEYLGLLRERIERRDRAIQGLRDQLGQMRALAGLPQLGEEEEEVPGLDVDLDALDKEERAAGNLAFYEDLDFDAKAPVLLGRKPSRRSGSVASAPSAAPYATEKAPTKRRTTRTSQAALQDDSAMDFEGVADS